MPYIEDGYGQFITTQVQADDAAAGILAQFLGAQAVIDFDFLVDPRLRPGDVVQVVREKLAVNETHVLDSLTIPLGYDASTTATTRRLAIDVTS